MSLHRWNVAFAVALALSTPGQVQQFRTSVTLVPVEVRVLGRDGAPIGDLAKTDFAIREGGAAQEIAHFEILDAADARAGRTFVIVLGRGRLNEPTGGMDGILEFVRSRLLAGDRVGVVAYNRALPPTTDHETMASFLERYRLSHVKTEGLLARDYASTMIPRLLRADTRSALNAAFEKASDPPIDLASGEGNSAIRYTDFSYLKKALGYLRTIAGEKHVVVITEEPFAVGRVSDNLLESFWFLEATSARAALHFIQTGGLPTPPGRISRGRSAVPVAALLGRQSQEAAAGQTGGSSAFFQPASKVLTELERSTRVRYLLGYYPTRDLPPDRYRQIDVRVNRPGATIIYRQGYQAQPAIEKPQDYRAAQIAARTDSGTLRLLNPATATVPNSDRGFTWEMKMTVATNAARQNSLTVTIAFDPLLAMFEKKGESHVMEMDLVLLVDDLDRRVLKEERRHLSVTLSAQEFARTKRQWPTFDITLDVAGVPAFVRGALYQFETDRLATAQVRIRR